MALHENGVNYNLKLDQGTGAFVLHVHFVQFEAFIIRELSRNRAISDSNADVGENDFFNKFSNFGFLTSTVERNGCDK